MKALSIKEPWASMICDGKKTIETRLWKTNYRGTILICCSKKPYSIRSGHAIATAELVDCRPMTFADEVDACCPLYEGAYSWVLKNVTRIGSPFRVNGKLGLFEVK